VSALPEATGDGAAWDALAAELDAWGAAGRRATLWWRDDDAGPLEPALERLLAFVRDVDIPLGLAVVPAWLTPEAAARLREHGPRVAILQHGVAHENHETTPPPGLRKVKPVELGPARPAPVVLDALVKARARLRSAAGPAWLAVLVPPWNRIAPAVWDALPALGYRGLSTFGPRDPQKARPGLGQVNCHVDPVVWREGKRFVGAAATLDRLRAHLAARREGAADHAEPTGLLTHHRDMGPDLWAFLQMLVPRLRAHPAVAFPPLAALFDDGAESGSTGPAAPAEDP
jgi:hypothetical protein